MFANTGFSYSALKSFRENDSRSVNGSCPSCDRPHIAHITAKINKAKNRTHIPNDQCLQPIKTSSSIKKHLKQAFCFITLFTDSHLVKYLSSMVTPIAVMALLLMSTLHCCQQRMFNRQTNYHHMLRISLSSAVWSKISIQIS